MAQKLQILALKNPEVAALKLHRQKLTALPLEIGAFTKLKRLDLRQNQLCDLPASIGALKQVQTFLARVLAVRF